ncbi:hypothetical protein NPIL_132312 [Nephila pilipes]|uniref:Uncharacterized protein n=1 Tax=Nephila pilipes TaxID=299642 RepID=A0A8X6PCS2_NEPPI|nr:hypothetical protein NPIL_132312 [Nephila pilipes]
MEASFAMGTSEEEVKYPTSTHHGKHLDHSPFAKLTRRIPTSPLKRSSWAVEADGGSSSVESCRRGTSSSCLMDVSLHQGFASPHKRTKSVVGRNNIVWNTFWVESSSTTGSDQTGEHFIQSP